MKFLSKLFEPFKKKCIFFHNWGDWSEPKSVIVKGENFIGFQQYRPYEYDGYCQVRFCKKCNKLEKRVI